MYKIKRAAELSDIPAVTIRAWEKRYNILEPNRSQGGHRLYSEKDLQTLKWLKAQVDQGLKISEAAELLKQKSIKQTRTLENSMGQINEKESLSSELYTHLITMNTIQANHALDLAFSLYSFQYVFHDIISPILMKIGTEWEAGHLTVAQEHFATELVTQRFHNVFRVLPVHPDQPKALAFCPEGEHHQFGLMMFSLFLKEKGVDVVYLGANTPYDGLIEQLISLNVTIVAVSVSHEDRLLDLIHWVNTCQAENSKLSFIIGGNGLEAFTPPELANVYFVKNLDDTDWESLI